MEKYRKRPLIIEAVRWHGPVAGSVSVDELMEWGAKVEPADDWSVNFTLLVWAAPERTWVRCPVGFWIIRGIAGEYYPCDPHVFDRTYEPLKGGDPSNAA